MKKVNISLVGLFLVLLTSCGSGTTQTSEQTTTEKPKPIDTLAVITKIDKQADSLSMLLDAAEKKTVFVEKLEGESIYDTYFYNANKELIQIDRGGLSGGETYSILNGKVIRYRSSHEEGENSSYIIDNQTFCETEWQGEITTLSSDFNKARQWSSELQKLIEAAKPQPLSEEQRKLVGKHKIRLQWLNKTGVAEIFEENGILKIKGEHLEKDGHLKVNGEVKYINDKELIITGTVSTQSSIVNNGEVCKREGSFNFKSTKGRKYWRMQQMSNCEGNRVVDYVDIFF